MSLPLGWLPAALLALGAFSGGYLLLTRLGTGLGPTALLTAICWGQGLIGVVHLAIVGAPPPSWSWRLIGGLAATVALLYLGNLAQLRALTIAPNPGWALAIIGASAALVCVIAHITAASPLGGLRLLGVALCVAGTALIAVAH